MLIRKQGFVTLICAAAPLAAAAAEQPASPADSSGIAEVVVTAQRREETANKVPISIEVVSPRNIETAGLGSLIDLPRIAPGLTQPPSAANVFFTPFLRGVGSNSPAKGNDPSVAVYIDGIYQSDSAANVLDFNDIERLEVLKGPQGTLFGRNATGGAINIITRQPQFSLHGDAEASYERFGKYVAKGYLTGPLNDALAGSVSYQRESGGDFARNINPVNPGDFGGVNNNDVDAKILWRPADRFELTASGFYSKRESSNYNSNLSPVAGTTPAGVLAGGFYAPKTYEFAGDPIDFQWEAEHATLRMKYSADKFDIVSLTGYVHTSEFALLDYDGTSAYLVAFNENQGVRDVSEELQFLSTGDRPLSWVAGGYFFDGKARIDPLNIISGVSDKASETSIIGTPGASATIANARLNTRAAAGYAQATYQLEPATRLTAGIRYTSERRSYQFTAEGLGQIAQGFYSPKPILLVQDDGQLHKTFNSPTWRLALDHQFLPETMGYVSYNRGFKSGTFNSNDFTPNQKPVNPEKLDAYEVGVKSKLLDRSLQLNLSAFYYKYSNIQVDVIVAGSDSLNATALQNAASERIYGLDFDLVQQPINNLQLHLNGSLLHAKYDDFAGAVALLPAVGASTNTLVDASHTEGLFAPKWSFTAGADYTVDLKAGWSLLFSTSYFRTAAFRVGVGPADRVNEYDSLGASGSLQSPQGFYVRLYGANLTNQQIVGTSAKALYISRDEIVPLTYGVAVGVRF